MLFNYEGLWKAFIRPSRQTYADSDLGPIMSHFNEHQYLRTNVQIPNSQGKLLQCSLFEPLKIKQQSESDSDSRFDCVIYCHGNSGGRLDSLTYLEELIIRGIGLFSFDFSGSGQSEGEFVTLGFNEQQDLKCVVDHLRKLPKIRSIALFGRSMGAVTTLLYAQKDRNLVGIIADSPFSNLKDLALEIAEKQMSSLPKFLIEGILSLLNSSVQERAGFRFEQLDIARVVQEIKHEIPILFIASLEDQFISCEHTKKLHQLYKGGRSEIRYIQGQHNSDRPKSHKVFLAEYLQELFSKVRTSQQSGANFEQRAHKITQQPIIKKPIGFNNHFRAASNPIMLTSLPNKLSSYANESPISSQLHISTSSNQHSHAQDTQIGEIISPRMVSSSRLKTDQSHFYKKYHLSSSEHPSPVLKNQNPLSNYNLLFKLQSTENLESNSMNSILNMAESTNNQNRQKQPMNIFPPKQISPKQNQNRRSSSLTSFSIIPGYNVQQVGDTLLNQQNKFTDMNLSTLLSVNDEFDEIDRVINDCDEDDEQNNNQNEVFSPMYAQNYQTNKRIQLFSAPQQKKVKQSFLEQISQQSTTNTASNSTLPIYNIPQSSTHSSYQTIRIPQNQVSKTLECDSPIAIQTNLNQDNHYLNQLSQQQNLLNVDKSQQAQQQNKVIPIIPQGRNISLNLEEVSQKSIPYPSTTKSINVPSDQSIGGPPSIVLTGTQLKQQKPLSFQDFKHINGLNSVKSYQTTPIVFQSQRNQGMPIPSQEPSQTSCISFSQTQKSNSPSKPLILQDSRQIPQFQQPQSTQHKKHASSDLAFMNQLKHGNATVTTTPLFALNGQQLQLNKMQQTEHQKMNNLPSVPDGRTLFKNMAQNSQQQELIKQNSFNSAKSNPQINSSVTTLSTFGLTDYNKNTVSTQNSNSPVLTQEILPARQNKPDYSEECSYSYRSSPNQVQPTNTSSNHLQLETFQNKGLKSNILQMNQNKGYESIEEKKMKTPQMAFEGHKKSSSSLYFNTQGVPCYQLNLASKQIVPQSLSPQKQGITNTISNKFRNQFTK